MSNSTAAQAKEIECQALREQLAEIEEKHRVWVSDPNNSVGAHSHEIGRQVEREHYEAEKNAMTAKLAACEGAARMLVAEIERDEARRQTALLQEQVVAAKDSTRIAWIAVIVAFGLFLVTLVAFLIK